MLQILNFRMRRAFWENFGENCRRERQKIVHSRSRKNRMKPSKTGNPLPKSQLDFESCSHLVLSCLLWPLAAVLGTAKTLCCNRFRTHRPVLTSSMSEITRVQIKMRNAPNRSIFCALARKYARRKPLSGMALRTAHPD